MTPFDWFSVGMIVGIFSGGITLELGRWSARRKFAAEEGKVGK